MLIGVLLQSLAYGQIISTIAGTGTPGYGGDGGNATAAQIYVPENLAVDSIGNVYIADSRNNRVRKVTPAGLITTIAGTGSAAYSGDGGQATAAELAHPFDITIDNGGNLFIVDNANHCIRKIDHSGVITTVVGTGAAGYSGDGGPATAATFYFPSALVFDDTGNMYISDCGNNCIRKVSVSGTVGTFAGTGTAGFSGDGGQATAAMLSSPWGMAIDGAGNLLIADKINYRIRKVSTTGIINTVSGGSTSGYSGDGGPASNARIYEPTAMIVDSTGNIYFSDNGNFRIRKITAAGIISTFAGNGIIGYSGDGGPATAAQIGYCLGLARSRAGELFLTDWYSATVRKITPCSVPVAATIHGPDSLCVGETATFSDTTAGGSWASANPAIATINAAGIVTASSPGNVQIYYMVSNACGADTVSSLLTVKSLGMCPDGVSLLNVINLLSVTPNPCHGKLMITAGYSGQAMTVTITNVLGQKIKEIITEYSNTTTVDLRVPAGIYYLSYPADSGKRVIPIAVE